MRITQKLVAASKPGDKPIEHRDTQIPGFILRIQPSGVKSYIVEYARGRRKTLGRATVLTLEQARRKALEVLADPAAATGPRKDMELRDFLSKHYEPWVKANRKDGEATVKRLDACFGDYRTKRLTELDAILIERWRTGRLKAGRAPATVNRDITALKAVLSKAVEWGVIEVHPLATVKPAKVADEGRVRYLDEAEEKRLRAILDEREEGIRAGRRSGNEWRKARNLGLLPDLDALPFADHIKPLVLLAMNTGLRRGELFNLKWTDVDLVRAQLIVRAAGAKSAKVRHIPLNREALDTLKDWQKTTGRKIGYVFPGKEGGRMSNIKKAWGKVLEDAELVDFRFHDLRHHFASRLVMAGADLYVVKELLGHATIAMTERYAHLAPEHKAAAVALLEVRQ